MPLYLPPIPPLALIADSGITTGGTSGTLGANTTYVYKYVLQVGVTITGMVWKATATAAGNVDVGIYSSDGNTLLGHTGATANTSATTNASANLTGGNLTLAPGVYLLAFSVGNNTDTFTRATNLGSSGHAMFPAYTAANNSTGTTSPVLPTTTGALTLSVTMPSFGGIILGGI